jgi:hypothetical protein
MTAPTSDRGASQDRSRARHPSSQPWRSDTNAFTGRLALRLASTGARWPDVAARVIAVRGATGLDSVAFARTRGVDVRLLALAEAGDVAPDDLPRRLLVALTGQGLA